jgi:hypothetical protein
MFLPDPIGITVQDIPRFERSTVIITEDLTDRSLSQIMSGTQASVLEIRDILVRIRTWCL